MSAANDLLDVRSWLLGCVGLGLLLCCGCSDDRVKVTSVQGTLLVGGKPAQGATVFFHPKSPLETNTGLPMGVVREDGSFAATTYVPGDGLPAGEYALTVTWPTKSPVEGEWIEGPDQLRGRFSQIEKPITTLTVAEGGDEIPPLELRIP